MKIEEDSKHHFTRAVFARTCDVSSSENSISKGAEESSVNTNALYLVNTDGRFYVCYRVKQKLRLLFCPEGKFLVLTDIPTNPNPNQIGSRNTYGYF